MTTIATLADPRIEALIVLGEASAAFMAAPFLAGYREYTTLDDAHAALRALEENK